MTLLVNIIDEEYERLKRSNFHTVVEECVRNGIPISNNTTNSDVMLTMFPNETDLHTFARHNKVTWWNAPYQKGGKQ